VSRRIVGIDIGHHAVHAVAVRLVDKQWKLLGAETVSRHDEFGAERPLSAILAELDASLGLSKKTTVYVSSSDIAALVKFVATTPMPVERLRKLLRLELSQHADANNELAADTLVVPIAGDEVIHLCVLAQPNQVYPLVTDLAKASVKAEAINFGAAAMYNATLLSSPVVDDDLALLIDIGAKTTQVALFGERRLLACRQLAMGGDAFTEALEKSLGVDFERAEQMKQHWAMAQPTHMGETAEKKSEGLKLGDDWLTDQGGSTAAHNAVTEITRHDEEHAAHAHADQDVFILLDDDHREGAHDDPSHHLVAPPQQPGHEHSPGQPVSAPPHHELSRSSVTELYDAPSSEMASPGAATMSVANSTLGPTLSKVAETLYSQIASTQSWFKAQLKREKFDITTVYISGGGASMVGLPSYFQRRFALPVKRFDPTTGFSGELPEHGHEYTVAIGLALSELPGAAKLDLLPEQLARKKEMARRLILPYAAAALLLFAIVLTGWTLVEEESMLEQNRDEYLRYKGQYSKEKGQLDELLKQKDDLSEDLRAIASRIFAGRDLLYLIRALKEKAAENSNTGLWVTRVETGGVASDQPSAVATPRVGGRHGGARVSDKVVKNDTSIQRGWVDISGRVQLDKEHPKTEDELKKYCFIYMSAILNWTPPDAQGQRLFTGMEYRELGFPLPTTKQNRNEPPEYYFFKYRFFFQPTVLTQVTSSGD
jgi:Tfp pilus assembly PilM family ATPase